MVKIEELNKTVLESMKKLLPNKTPEAVVGAEKAEKGGWKLLMEVVERKAIPDSQDLIGIYEVRVGSSGEILNYKKIESRIRTAI